MARRYWLMKTEPDVFSFEDLKSRPNQTEPWNGVRNYQARNYMRDDMQVGDGVFFYHSRSGDPGIVGLATVARTAYPDPTSWDPASDYFDPKASPENPRWIMVDIKYDREMPKPVSLATIKATPELIEMKVAQRGQRLSVQPVTAEEWRFVCKLGGLTGKE